jgi:hypothetical protein
MKEKKTDLRILSRTELRMTKMRRTKEAKEKTASVQSSRTDVLMTAFNGTESSLTGLAASEEFRACK